MPATYFDTSCLVRRAELSGPAPTARTQHAGPPVAAALGAASGPIGTSEVGLLEFHDVVTGMWRDTNHPNDVFGETWCTEAINELMGDVDQGRLSVLPQPPKVFERAMTLVTMCTRDHGRKFRVWDAVHLLTAVRWSIDRTEQIELWTTDGDFEGFVALYPYFANYVVVCNLDH